jgi:hypothetical protein
MKAIGYIVIGKCLLSTWLWVELVHHLVLMKSVCNEHHQVLDLHDQLCLLQLHVLGPHRAANTTGHHLNNTVQNSMVFTVSWSAQKCRGVDSNFWLGTGFILMQRIGQSSPGTVTRPWLGDLAFNSWQGKGIFVSPKCLDWHWTPVVLSPGVKHRWSMKLTTHPHLVLMQTIIGAIPLLPYKY